MWQIAKTSHCRGRAPVSLPHATSTSEPTLMAPTPTRTRKQTKLTTWCLRHDLRACCLRLAYGVKQHRTQHGAHLHHDRPAHHRTCHSDRHRRRRVRTHSGHSSAGTGLLRCRLTGIHALHFLPLSRYHCCGRAWSPCRRQRLETALRAIAKRYLRRRRTWMETRETNLRIWQSDARACGTYR